MCTAVAPTWRFITNDSKVRAPASVGVGIYIGLNVRADVHHVVLTVEVCSSAEPTIKPAPVQERPSAGFGAER